MATSRCRRASLVGLAVILSMSSVVPAVTARTEARGPQVQARDRSSAGPCATTKLDPRDAREGLDIKRSTIDVTDRRVTVIVETFERWKNADVLVTDPDAGPKNLLTVDFDNADNTFHKSARLVYEHRKLSVMLIDWKDMPENEREIAAIPRFPARRVDARTVSFSLPLDQVRASRSGFFWGVDTAAWERAENNYPCFECFDKVPNDRESPEHWNGWRYQFLFASKRQPLQAIGWDATEDSAAGLDLAQIALGREGEVLQIQMKIEGLDTAGMPPLSGARWRFSVGGRRFSIEARVDPPATVPTFTLYRVEDDGPSKVSNLEGEVDADLLNFFIPLRKLARGDWRGTEISGAAAKGDDDVFTYLSGPAGVEPDADGMDAERPFVLC